MRENKLWYGSPSAFNDPFDCKPFIGLPLQADALRKLISKTVDGVLAKHKLNVDQSDLEALVASFHENAPDITNQLMHEVIARDTGVLCMSKTPSNIQQWAYYADDHHGVCLGIDMSNLDTGDRHEIQYVEQRDVLSLEDILNESATVKLELFESVVRKHRSWQHEEEVRFFQKQGEQAYPPENLKTIYFGTNCTDYTIDYVDRVVELSDSSPSFGLVRPSRTSFNLEIVEDITCSHVKEVLTDLRQRIQLVE